MNFSLGMPNLINLRLEFPWKYNYHVRNQHSDTWDSSCKNNKHRAKIVLFGCFRAEFEKRKYCHIWNQQNARFHVTHTKKFDTKITLFGYFPFVILKNYCHIWNQHRWICGIAKFHIKWEIFKLKTKNG